jgi:peroxiredoxin
MLRSKFVIAAAAALFAVALIGASVQICAALSVGSKAPDFKLSGFDGKTIQLSDYTDKPTVLVFWASWCPHCVRELPVMDRLYKDLHPKGVNFIGINMDSTVSKGKDYVSSHRISFPMASAKSGIAESYQITGIPSIFILGKGGVLKAKYAGEVDEATIRSDLAKLGVK